MEFAPRSSRTVPHAPAPSPGIEERCHGQATVPGGSRMEVWISHVLRAGVLLAGTVIALGLAFLLVRGAGASDPLSLAALRRQDGHPLPVHPGDLIRHARVAQPTALVQLGILLLILTPVARVAMTVWLFVEQRDPVFVAITLVVLVVLVFGLVHTGL